MRGSEKRNSLTMQKWAGKNAGSEAEDALGNPEDALSYKSS